MAIENASLAILVENHYEDLELWYPYYRLREAGADVCIAGMKKGESYASKHGYPAEAEVAVEDLSAERLAGVIVPGGYAPDRMRRHQPMIQLVRNVWIQGGVTAFICHAGWMAISADILRDKKATSVAAIKDDMMNAGAQWVDEEVVKDGNLVTSRMPRDLPAFCKTILQMLEPE